MGDEFYAVITGDIVGSSQMEMEERRELPEMLAAFSERLREQFPSVPYPVSIYRGDSWQFLVNDPARSLRIGIYFRTLVRSTIKVKGADTRMGIGIGTVDFLIQEELSRGDGQAFRLSGECLERLEKSSRVGIAFPDELSSPLSEAVHVILAFMDGMVTGWTAKQSRAISGAIVGYTQEEIAARCFEKEISQQAVAQHLKRADWSTFEKGTRFFERFVPQILPGDERGF
ncbi:MAG: hypothetical protein ACQEQQ_09755 [Chloroflexota bacterium]